MNFRLRVFVMMIFLSQVAEADVQMLMQCGAKAEVVQARMHGQGMQDLEIKVIEHWDAYAMDKGSCRFLQIQKNYRAQVLSVYRGKILKVPPLKPGQLAVGDQFQAYLTLNSESDPIFWNMRQNKKGIKKDTSFHTPFIKK